MEIYVIKVMTLKKAENRKGKEKNILCMSQIKQSITTLSLSLFWKKKTNNMSHFKHFLSWPEGGKHITSHACEKNKRKNGSMEEKNSLLLPCSCETEQKEGSALYMASPVLSYLDMENRQ